MNKQEREKVGSIIITLQSLTEELKKLQYQEEEPLKRLPYSKLLERDLKTKILGKNTVDFCRAMSEINECITHLEDILCREVTE